jgi:hypothetical protein
MPCYLCHEKLHSRTFWLVRQKLLDDFLRLCSKHLMLV